MSLFENFPYTNFHELNLDWIVKMIKEMNMKLDEAVASKITVADPIQWDLTSQYEPFTIVMDHNNAYLSIAPVSYGIPISDEDYWIKIFDLSQIFSYLKRACSFNDDDNSPTSSSAREVNDLVWLNNILYKVIQPIAVGEAYGGTNVEQISIENWVKALLNSTYTQLENDLEELEEKIKNLYKRSRKSVIFIGDSYGIDTDDWQGWLTKFGTNYGSFITTHGRCIGGSGFKQGSDQIQNFNTTLTEVLETMTDLQKELVTDVIAVGGYNDVSREATEDQLVIYMNQFKNTALTACPNAKVSVGFVGFHYGSATNQAKMRAMCGYYIGACTRTGISYINHLNLVLLNKEYVFIETDNPSSYFHPNNSGNTALAKHLCNYILSGDIGDVGYAEILSNNWNVYSKNGTVYIFTTQTQFFGGISGQITFPPNVWRDVFDLSTSNLLWFFNQYDVVAPSCFSTMFRVGSDISDYTTRQLAVRFRNNKVQMANLTYNATQSPTANDALTLPSLISLPWESVY